MTETKKKKAENVGKALFGATLSSQGKGFYVTLEMLSLIQGTRRADSSVLPDGLDQPLVFSKCALDFARRLLADPPATTEAEKHWLANNLTTETLVGLLQSLLVPIPNRRKKVEWYSQHLFPYIGDLVHYDVVARRKRVPGEDGLGFSMHLDQHNYRGGGALAHKALRTDPDQVRLRATRAGFETLLAESKTPLGELVRVLASRDLANRTVSGGEERAPSTVVREHEARPQESHWIDALRSGVSQIVSRIDLAPSKRSEALMFFIPFCIAHYQLSVAQSSIQESVQYCPIAFPSASPVIRQASRASLTSSTAVIARALENRAKTISPELADPSSSKSWRDLCRGFFTSTLAVIGGLNAHTGSRHYTLGPELLEALTLASLKKDEEIPLAQFFTRVLHGRFGLVVDATSAHLADNRVTRRVDRNAWAANSAGAAESLRELGLLRDYSDMTKLVHGKLL